MPSSLRSKIQSGSEKGSRASVALIAWARLGTSVRGRASRCSAVSSASGDVAMAATIARPPPPIRGVKVALMSDAPTPADDEPIRVAVADGVMTITLNRPQRLNAWTPLMGERLIAALDAADADDAVRAVIVTGEGRGFCAGADLAGGGDTFDWRRARGSAG